MLPSLDCHLTALPPGRHVHLVLENEHNQASLLHDGFTAQWNDDLHHALHYLVTGEAHYGYGPGGADAWADLEKALRAKGFKTHHKGDILEARIGPITIDAETVWHWERIATEIYRAGEGAGFSGVARFRVVREETSVPRGEVVPLWLSVLALCVFLREFSVLASWLIVPYLAWVSFAACLNFVIVRLNRPFG